MRRFYRVTWTVDVEAESATEAAQNALPLVQGEAQALHFKVQAWGHNGVESRIEDVVLRREDKT